MLIFFDTSAMQIICRQHIFLMKTMNQILKTLPKKKSKCSLKKVSEKPVNIIRLWTISRILQKSCLFKITLIKNIYKFNYFTFD